MKQKNAYNRLTNHYDDVLTGRKWWSWLYMHCLWKTDDNIIAGSVLDMIPDGFEGRILDVPVGTAIFTYDKYTILICTAPQDRAFRPIWKRFSNPALSEIGRAHV